MSIKFKRHEDYKAVKEVFIYYDVMTDVINREEMLLGQTIRDDHSIVSENFSEFDENEFLLSKFPFFNTGLECLIIKAT